jgi:hypothetical protein
MVKLRQKLSGTMGTKAGAEAFCAIRSYLASAAKHGLTHFAALARLAEGNPWLPDENPDWFKNLHAVSSQSYC